MELDNNRVNRVTIYIVYTYTTRKIRGVLRTHDSNTNTLTNELDYASRDSSPTHNNEEIFKIGMINNCVLIETKNHLRFCDPTPVDIYHEYTKRYYESVDDNIRNNKT